MDNDEKWFEVHRRTVILAESVSSMCTTDRQVNNKESRVINFTREMPQHLAVGLAIHHLIRSKEIISLLHGFGMSVD